MRIIFFYGPLDGDICVNHYDILIHPRCTLPLTVLYALLVPLSALQPNFPYTDNCFLGRVFPGDLSTDQLFPVKLDDEAEPRHSIQVSSHPTTPPDTGEL